MLNGRKKFSPEIMKIPFQGGTKHTLPHYNKRENVRVKPGSLSGVSALWLSELLLNLDRLFMYPHMNNPKPTLLRNELSAPTFKGVV